MTKKFSRKKIGILGCGVMGSVILEALVSRNDRFDLFVLDRDPARAKHLQKKYKGKVVLGNSIEHLSECAVVILAVKPQDFAAADIHVAKDALVISIMAGVTTASIRKMFGTSRIIRAMPNMPARIGKGYTGWFCTKAVTPIDRQFAGSLFKLMGTEIEVAVENDINKITAVSGSGPAYLFYTIQNFITAAISIGIKENIARKMTFETVQGSLAMLAADTDFPQLIKNVASKGGTTEAALAEFDTAKIPTIWKKAVAAAYARAKELSK